MRVTYKTKQGGNVYEETGTDFCCTGMTQWWGRLIGFGVSGVSSTSRTVNLYLSRPQANGKTVLEIMPIDYCPFCGEAVELRHAKKNQTGLSRFSGGIGTGTTSTSLP